MLAVNSDCRLRRAPLAAGYADVGQIIMNDNKRKMTKNAIEFFMGEVVTHYAPILETICLQVTNAQYSFRQRDDVLQADASEALKIYWSEILFRCHWAAATNALRHKRWLDGCALAYLNDNPNFLAFAAAFRGMVEAAGDAYYSLRQVPLALARNFQVISAALDGFKQEALIISKELEDALIHFQFARKLTKNEKDFYPITHQSKLLTDYVNALDEGSTKHCQDLYAELCQLVHPASQSMMWFAEGNNNGLSLTPGDDREWIRDLCLRNKSAIEHIQAKSLNTTIMILKILNRFSLTQLYTACVDDLCMDAIPQWREIDAKFASR